MREIKFRAWDIKENKMLDDVCTNTDDFTNMLNETFAYFQQDLIFLQYTGLKDKNGVEICEGDVVQKRNGSISEVRFGEYCFTGGEYSTQGVGFYLYTSEDKGMFGQYDFPTKSEKVIGNIYQNPELLAK